MTGPAAADGRETSGIDLAKAALRAARAASVREAARPAPLPRTIRARQADGRDPLGLAAVLEGLVAARAWEAPAAGGGILADWPRIAPKLADHVQAAAFDAATGCLDLRPDSPAWATHLRLQTPALLARIAEHTGTRTVRTIRVLAPAAPDTSGTAANADNADTTPAPTAEPAPRTRQEPPVGYRQAIAAHRAAVPEQQPTPGIRAAAERQDQALAWHREPEEVFRTVLADQAQGARQAERGPDSYRRAREQAARDRAARGLPTIGHTAAARFSGDLRDSA